MLQAKLALTFMMSMFLTLSIPPPALSAIMSHMNRMRRVLPHPVSPITIFHLCNSLFILHCRCNIPVVVMGETGCGKTRLIRFMCDMIALSAGGGIDSVRNMLIMKVSASLACSMYS